MAPHEITKEHRLSMQLATELHRRMKIDHVFEEFIQKGNSTEGEATVVPKNFACLRRLIEVYETSCEAKLEEYDLFYVRFLVQECEKLPVPSAIDALIHRLQKACRP